MADKRNRRTQEEMLAHYKAKADALQAKIEGRGGDEAGSDLVANLKRRLRKTETALRSAQIMLNGVVKEDGKGWQRAPIDEKIEMTRTRLQTQIDARDRADSMATTLPFDVNRLKLLIEAANVGEDVEFPNDLTPLRAPGATVKSDEEVESDFIANEEAEARA